jgi:protein gp37
LPISNLFFINAEEPIDGCLKPANLPIQPLLENLDIEKYLHGVELVVVGGESDRKARPLDYDWVLNIREQCKRQNVHFEFRQWGTHFIKDGKRYLLAVKDLCDQARKANINL